jgi:hypothetical protein
VVTRRVRTHRDGRVAVHLSGRFWVLFNEDHSINTDDSYVTMDGWREAVLVECTDKGAAEVAHAMSRVACCPVDAEDVADCLELVVSGRAREAQR